MSTTKTPALASPGPTLGRRSLEKISAVEGIKTSASTKRMFAEFDRKGLSAEERRRQIFHKHTKTP